MVPSIQSICYPFSMGIPWHLEKSVIIPKINKDIWGKCIGDKPARIICPGFIPEAMMVGFIYKALSRNNVNLKQIIIPKYYEPLIKMFGIKTDIPCEYDPMSEFERISRGTMGYIAPIFFDNDDNVYFKILNNYGRQVNYKNKPIKRNIFPFWKQMLDNTCSNCFIRLSDFDSDMAGAIAIMALKKLGIEKRYFIIDNSDAILESADGRDLIRYIVFPSEIKKMCAYLKEHDIECVVICNESLITQYKASGIKHVLPPWDKIRSDIFASLVYSAYGVMSSDPSIFLLAAMFGINNIICLGNNTLGFDMISALDIAIDKGKRNWTHQNPCYKIDFGINKGKDECNDNDGDI